MAKKAISTTGLNETLAALEAVTNITGVSKAAIYAGAGVVIDTMKEEISSLQVTRYYGTDQRKRYCWPNDAKVLLDAIGIAKIQASETVNTKVGFDGYYYADNGERYPIPLLANSINAGTSFMYRQPFIDNTLKRCSKKAIQAMNEIFEVEQNLSKNISDAKTDLTSSINNTKEALIGNIDDAKEALEESIQDTEKKLQDEIDSVTAILVDVQAYIKSGLLYYDSNGIPVYGVEVGQTNEVNGQEIFNKYARFSSDRLAFFDQNGTEVAYISDRKLFISNVEITVSFKLGGFMDTVMSNKSVVTKWVGGG